MQHLTVKELKTIEKIAERAVALYLKHDMLDEHRRKIAVLMMADELLTVHRDIIKLRLDDMLTGSDFDLIHDVAGIHRHLEHGKQRAHLTECFLPRYAVA